MSTKVLNLCWDLDLPLTRKMVLISLADQANDYGESYPGMKSLCRRCSMARRTVYEAMAELETEGFITREHVSGVRTLYTIQLQRLQQGDLLGKDGGCATRTRAPRAPVHQPQDCATRKEGGAGGAHIEATKSKATSGGTRTRAQQLEVMGSFDRGVIDPYLAELPESIETQVFADFVKHRQVTRGPLSFSSWRQVLTCLKALEADGVDLNASLRETMLLGLAKPVDPRPKSNRGGAPPRKVAADFSTATYEGTSHDASPSFLDEPAPAGDDGDAG